MEFNKYQSTVEELNLESYPEEVKEQFWDYISNVPYINYAVRNTLRAADLPRDEYGRIIVDVTKPHVLEDMDYFRPAALYFKKNGCYTKLRPNPNPNSEYGKWIREEVRRCWEGYVRESDGEWIPGNLYFFLNYCPIPMTKMTKGSKKGERIVDFPEFWEGIYYRFHYIELALHGGIFNQEGGNNGCEISSRGKSKSLTMASIMAKYFVLGESKNVREAVRCMATAYLKQYLVSDGILNKFQSYIDFLALNTQFPSKRLKSSLQDMAWKMGYIDVDTGALRGTLNEVIGVSAKDDVSKVRGKRLNFIVVEEFGSFRNVLELYNIMLPSVLEGDISFGTIYLVGTAGDLDSDFQGAAEIVYNPKGYRMYALPNVWDKEGLGRKSITYFFPGYINRKGCYDENGNSDITKALLEILSDRYRVKYNSSDINSIAKTISEIPITPLEAILRTRGNMFPVTLLNERLNQLDSNPNSYDDVYIGNLVLNKSGQVEFVISNDSPIRDFPLKDNLAKGAIEIYLMPEKASNGKVYSDRYILGHDPVDHDLAESLSLTSTFVLDLWTDKIVAEYTGRLEFADDNFEILRLLCLFYNGKCMYEAHPYDLLVRMPDGSVKTWEEVKVGDNLLSIDGRTTLVIDIPMDGEDDIYRVTLDDGRTVEASGNHIWTVYELDSQEPRNFTTKEMLDIGINVSSNLSRFFLPDCLPIPYSHKYVPINPYSFGMLLAKKSFAEFGVNNSDKFIPDIYLYNDPLIRAELLRGLMEGGGWVNIEGISIFRTSSQQLSIDIKLLCRGLGIKCMDYNSTDSESATKDKINSTQTKSYEVAVLSDIPIYPLTRKTKQLDACYIGDRTKEMLYKTAIASIDYIGRKKCKCVTVDRQDGLYLIGDYVVTHNCNKKGCYSYFSRMNSLHLLADTPEYLKDKLLIKQIGYGNQSKGINATAPINSYANTCIRDWLLKPVPIIINEDGQEKEVNVPNLYHLKNRALLKELVLFNGDINVDRVRSLGMVMLYREEKMILYQGSPLRNENVDLSAPENDEFFTNNYDRKF